MNSPIKRLIIGGIAIGILVFFIPPLYGEGYEVINHLVQGNPKAALENNFFNINTQEDLKNAKKINI